MRITQEADYAIRICCVLDDAGEKLGASEIAERAGVTQRFALKILRKLCASQIVKSFIGSNGGYVLERDGKSLNVVEVIEAIDGPICISKCIEGDYDCTRNPVKSHCKMHVAFCCVNRVIREKLTQITVRMLTDSAVSTTDVAAITNKK